ncbi:macrophage mannose receptor 1-like [Solea solea]|uniref:macrophage mannose receptor 1-like n=1 Tax=Solea solea TaxID=90069 RepID=UPI00272D8944|nr:macrophage mannose receptor 1-like [Solea solea]
MRETQSFFMFFTGLCCLRPCRPLQYHFIDAALPWLKAQNYCRATFTDLATVFDAESLNLLVNAAQQSSGGFTGKAWIGLRDNLTNWRWSFPDAATSFRNWGIGQPDNFFGDQMCVRTIIGGVWEDSSCVLRNPFFCYDGFFFLAGTASFSKRFVFVAQELSWSDAQRHCRRRYTDLASVRNRDENTQIRRLSIRGAWIGLHRSEEKCFLSSAPFSSCRTRDWSDGSESSFRYWTSGQPDNARGKQSCVAAHLGNAGRWSDEECGRSLAFVCYGERVTTTEKPSTTPPLTERTSSEPPSTTHMKPILTFTDETPNETTLSGSATATQEKSTTTTEIHSTTPVFTSSVQFETSKLEQTTTIGRTLETHLSSAATVTRDKTATTDRDSTTPVFTSPATAELDQTTPVPGFSSGEHVIHLGLKLTSKVQLSEEDIEELVVVEFRKRLVEMGLPSSLKVSLKKPRK